MSDFESLFLSYYGPLLQMMQQIIGVRQEAEDLVQESFMRLHSHFAEIDPEKHKAWLYRAAINLGYSVLRRRQVHNRWAHGHVDLPVAERNQTEQVMWIRKSLAAMPEKQVKILFLYAAGLSYEEMAEALEVKPSSISQLLLRAKQAFKHHYGEG